MSNKIAHEKSINNGFHPPGFLLTLHTQINTLLLSKISILHFSFLSDYKKNTHSWIHDNLSSLSKTKFFKKSFFITWTKNNHTPYGIVWWKIDIWQYTSQSKSLNGFDLEVETNEREHETLQILDQIVKCT